MTEAEATAPPFWGADYARTANRGPSDGPTRNDGARMNDMVRASAFGRAKGRLLDALAEADPAVREQRLDALVLLFVDFALERADVRTVLDGLA